MTTKTNGHKHRSNGHTAVKRVSTLGSKLRKLYGRDKIRLRATTTKITNAAHDAREKIVEVEQSVQKYAKAHPWQTMGISVLAGVVVARILNIRK